MRAKELTTDGVILDKARFMASRKKRDGSWRYSNEFISDELGLVIEQVEQVRRSLPQSVRGRPAVLAFDALGTNEEASFRMGAMLGSEALARRINEVFGRAG